MKSILFLMIGVLFLVSNSTYSKENRGETIAVELKKYLTAVKEKNGSVALKITIEVYECTKESQIKKSMEGVNQNIEQTVNTKHEYRLKTYEAKIPIKNNLSVNTLWKDGTKETKGNEYFRVFDTAFIKADLANNCMTMNALNKTLEGKDDPAKCIFENYTAIVFIKISDWKENKDSISFHMAMSFYDLGDNNISMTTQPIVLYFNEPTQLADVVSSKKK